MKKLSIVLVVCILATGLNAQKYFTKEGNITFYSDAPTEKIEATNSKATSVVDMESGAMQWSVLIKAFKFEKALMEEHFNENYMESSKYPKASFKGSITNMTDIDLTTDGEYNAEVTGTMDIHGVQKEINAPGTFTVTDGVITGNSEFEITLADYNIEIPAVVADNISKTVLIKINSTYQELSK